MIYLDNAATTPVKDSVKQSVNEMLDEFFNPSSAYKPARDLYYKIAKARENIASALAVASGIEKWNVMFTSGGTESNNWAIKSLADLRVNNCCKKRIISSVIEHPSVFNTLESMKNEGYEIIRLSPNRDGFIDPEDLRANLTDDTALVTIMMVNNQIGTIQPIRAMAKICKEFEVPMHSDCVQAVGHIKVDLDDLGVQAISASSHKFGGLKGNGFLVVDKSIDLPPLLYGGKQNFGKRPGTEDVIGIVTTATALVESIKNMRENNAKMLELKHIFFQEMNYWSSESIMRINGSLSSRAPGNINISFKNVLGSDLETFLEGNDVYVSTTSACETGVEKSNRVLEAIGVPPEFINGTIRISLSEHNTIEEIIEVTKMIKEFIEGVSRWEETQE